MKSIKVGELSVDDSVIRKHYFYIELRPGEKQCLFLIQAIRGRGAKSVFEEAIKETIKIKTQGLSCQIRPLAPKGIVNDWFENAQICELRMSHFSSSGVLNDITDRLGETYTEVKIKPKKRNLRLGRIADLDTDLVDILNDNSQVVKVQVEYNGRKRLFQLGNSEQPVSSVEIDEIEDGVKFEDGNPTFDGINTFAKNLASDVWPSLLREMNND